MKIADKQPVTFHHSHEIPGKPIQRIKFTTTPSKTPILTAVALVLLNTIPSTKAARIGP